MTHRDYASLEQRLVSWLEDKILESGCEGGVVGLSGGVDSSVTASLLKEAFSDHALGVILPCESDGEDTDHARLVAQKLDLETVELDLSATYRKLMERIRSLEVVGNYTGRDVLAFANIKPRLRMTTLYCLAGELNRLVIGTDNRSEMYVGYFTKYGDGGIDLAPLGRLVKQEVYGLAQHMGLPREIIEKPPSAGLFADQTDEEEMGFTYQQLDHYLLTGLAEPEVEERIESLRKRNLHKLRLPPRPEF